MWYMRAVVGKVPSGWRHEPAEGYIAVSDAIRVLHEQHADYIWDSVTLVPYVPPVYIPTPEEVAAAEEAAKYQADSAAANSYAKLTSLKSMSPAQVQAWVDANVLTLADAKDALKTLAVAVSLLARRI